MRAWSLLLLVALLALESQLPAASGRRKKEKNGGCPPDDGPCLLPVPDQCVDDSQCPTRMKCCRRSCFRQCVLKVAGLGLPGPKPMLPQRLRPGLPEPCQRLILV
ncbi:WAP four-disulfide core domain protein 5 isoform 2-T2 [Molossus nigricans]